ncbi:large ribosomal subunit protein eL29-like [Arvicanthis niloticus]|uniref:large ribosomal subunit protein eL29-like n=1 Tax=Arvicanthis niloticus TaxID=61156 RepID=UPI00402BEBEB
MNSQAQLPAGETQSVPSRLPTAWQEEPQDPQAFFLPTGGGKKKFCCHLLAKATVTGYRQALREAGVTVQTRPSPRTTPHTTSPINDTEMPPRNSSHRDTNLLRGFLRNMRFAKKHNKKGHLEKMQASSAKAVSAHAEAIKALVKPQALKPKMPKGPSHKLSRLAFIAHLEFGKQFQSYMAKGHRLCQPKPKVQTKAEAKAPAKAQVSAPAQAPKGAQASVKVP